MSAMVVNDFVGGGNLLAKIFDNNTEDEQYHKQEQHHHRIRHNHSHHINHHHLKHDHLNSQDLHHLDAGNHNDVDIGVDGEFHIFENPKNYKIARFQIQIFSLLFCFLLKFQQQIIILRAFQYAIY